MKSIVITGATSFVGIHLIRRWLKTDCHIYAVVRPDSKNINRLPEDERISFVELDLQDYGKLPMYISEADVFYHFAWEGTRMPYRDNDQMQEANYRYAVNAMEAAMKMGCKCFVGSGSQAEYGVTNGPVDENHPCIPLSAYGKYKLKTCEALANMADKTEMRLIWVRIFSLYGEYDYAGSLIMACLEKMSRNEPMEMTACTQMWDYLYIEDASEALFRFAQVNCKNGIYNLASGEARPLKEYVNDIRDVLCSESVIHFGVIPYGIDGPISLEPRVEKIRNALGWKTDVSFKQAISNLLKL